MTLIVQRKQSSWNTGEAVVVSSTLAALAAPIGLCVPQRWSDTHTEAEGEQKEDFFCL